MTSVPNIFDHDVYARRRAHARVGAAEHDFLLQRVADDFVERLSIVKRQFPLAADIGAHHGVVAGKLKGHAGIEQMIEVSDIAAAAASGARVVSSPETIPLAPHSVDLVVSALSLHLVNDLPGVLTQIRNALRPDGFFLAALLGSETLQELRHAWMLAEEEITGGVSPRVAPFADVRALGGLMQRAGFALPVIDSEVVTVRYASPLVLMRELKGMGASNMLTARRRVPVTRELLLRANEIYAEQFSDDDARVRATFEIITLTGWAPHDSQPKPLRPGSAQMRLADVLGTTEHKAGDKAGK